MYWWIPMAAGAALGAMKNAEASKQTDEANSATAAENNVQAIRELWSPFTGQHGQNRAYQSKPSLMGDVGGGAIAGLAMTPSINAAMKGSGGGGTSATDVMDPGIASRTQPGQPVGRIGLQPTYQSRNLWDLKQQKPWSWNYA